MEILKITCWTVQLVSAISIIVLVLLQHGKGADAGATFGAGGGSGSLFGATGASNFLSHATAIIATIFFITTFGLVLLISNGSNGSLGVMSGYAGYKISPIKHKPVTTLPAVKNNSSAAKASSKAKTGTNQIPG